MNLHRVRTAGEIAFDGLLRVYTAAHPASERKSADALRQMIERPEYLFLAVTEAEVVVGFAIAIALADCDGVLIEYMAVDAEHRGRGIGKLLFRAIAGWPEALDRFLLAEVDSAAAALSQGDDRVRRKNFYRRLGCRQIEGLVYVMPPVTSAVPPPMDVLVYRRELPACVEKEHVRRWLEAIYAQVYGVAAGDPRIDAMLDGLADCISLTN